MKSTQLPSVIGVGSTDMGLLTAGRLGNGRRTTKPHTISWGGVKSGMKSPLFRGLKRPLISGKNVRWTGGGGCFRIR